MQHSESKTGETLAQALLGAQRTVGSVPKGHTAEVKNKEGRFLYAYKFAAGEDMISAARSSLLQHGLTWALVSYEISPGNPPILHGTYMLEHAASAEQRLYTYPMPIAAANHADKALAGALTYLTSYALRGILNIPREDPNEPDKRTKEKDGVGFGDGGKSPVRQSQRKKPTPAQATKNLAPVLGLAEKLVELSEDKTRDDVLEWGEKKFLAQQGRKVDYGRAADATTVGLILSAKIQELEGGNG